MASEHVEQDDLGLDECGGATATTVRQKPAPTKREPQKLPPFKVLLHNDDVNTFDHVIRSIVRLTPIQAEEAVVIVAFNSGYRKTVGE